MQIKTLVTAALAVVALACRDDRAEAAVDTALLPADTTSVALAGGDTALSEPRRDSAVDPAATASPDGKALGAFIAASQHEIQHGRLAIEKGSSQPVRDLGRGISRDHDDFVQRARALGTRLSIAPAAAAQDTTMQGHPDAMKDLRANSGTAFDRAFLQHEIEYHRWLINAINTTMLPYATNEELKTFLQQAVPAFDAHMKGAQDLLAKLPST
jgi:putative membrane protein